MKAALEWILAFTLALWIAVTGRPIQEEET